MIILAFTTLLFAIAAILSLFAYRRDPSVLKAGFADAKDQFVHLLPRLLVGIMGSGFLAHLLPKEAVLSLFGPNSGLMGTAMASLAGALTPGGPVVGFALAAAALKAGAGDAQVIAFVTAWSLFTLNRMISWEIPSMPIRIVLLRVAISLPFPFLAAGATGLLR
ncbi:hypothetical protein MCEMSEM23_01611 [Rhabdaerophilaceae bacterium]